MKRRHLIIGGAAAAVALALGLFGVKAGHYAAFAHGRNHDAVHGAWHGGGWHEGRHGGGMAHFCTDAGGERFDRMAQHIKSELAMTAAQEAAWDEFSEAWREGEKHLRAACDTAESERPGMDGLLARAEIQLDAGLGAVRAVRPAFEAFYATLDDTQRRTLDQFGRR
jgi:hypothetical protein